MKRLLFAFVYVVFGLTAKAQYLREIHTIVLPADSVFKTEIITNPYEKNFFLVAIRHESKTDWLLHYYDTATRLAHQAFIKKTDYERIIYARNYQNTLYLLSNVSDKIYYVRVWQPNKGIVEFKYENTLKMSIDFFEPIAENSFVIAGETRSRPVAILFKPSQSPDVRVLPIVSQIDGKITELTTNMENGMIGIAIKGTGGNAKFKSFYARFDAEGTLLAQTVFQESYQFSINSITTALLSWHHTWLIASYGIDRADNSQGLCLIRLQEDETPIIYPYDFGDWYLFFAHYSPKAQRKLKEKIAARRKKGKIYPLGSRVLLHKPVLLHDTIYVSGELYEFARGNTTGYRYSPYPTRMSMTANYWEGHPLYAPPPPTQYQPDLYRFKQFFTTAVTLDGKKLGDNQIQINDYTSLELRPNGLALYQKDSICMVYHTEKEIRTTYTDKNAYNKKNDILTFDVIQEEKYTVIDCFESYQHKRMITLVQSKIDKKRKWIISIWEL